MKREDDDVHPLGRHFEVPTIDQLQWRVKNCNTAPRAVQRFGVDRMVGDYLAVYARLVSRDHHTRPAKRSPLISRYP